MECCMHAEIIVKIMIKDKLLLVFELGQLLHVCRQDWFFQVRSHINYQLE